MLKSKQKAAIIYYSYSSQTAKLVQSIKQGLEQEGIEALSIRLKPKKRLSFPFESTFQTLYMMLRTFFRMRVPIEEPDLSPLKDAEFVVLGGPTWSYNPSGPILSFLDDYADALRGKRVIPLISCRKYWRHHYQYLKRILEKHGAIVEEPLVFDHKVKKEPWSAIGTFLTLAGKMPKHDSVVRRHYPKYGHAKSEFERAKILASKLAKKFKSK